jgi:glutamyl/glutaminyl-tRNA synthetase
MELLSQPFHKTRIAPTPSGFLHAGNILSFAITAWLAEQAGARILLRIDDLDQQRVQSAYLGDIFETLQFLQLPWQEGPENQADFETGWSQVRRESIYREALDALAGTGRVFACNCSRTDLDTGNHERVYPGHCRSKNIPLDQPETCWRLETDPSVPIGMTNMDGTVTEYRLPAAMQDFIVRKKDGHASYQLASLCDDIHFGIDLIVRGNDLLDSTLAQLYLGQVLETPAFGNTAFYHHPLLLQNGMKLSKSAGDTSIWYLRRQGWDARRIFERIGELAGITEMTQDWRSLAATFFK